MTCLAIIPARGGSKGIPGKNLRMLCGMPLVAHSILTAQRSACIDRVVVSTDHDEIADVAVQYGAEVVKRPSEIAGDRSSSELALLHTLEMLAEDGYRPDTLFMIQCTAPLTEPCDIDEAMATFEREGADSLLAVSTFHRFIWAKGESGEGTGIGHDPSHRAMRQDREEQYLEAGAFYLMRCQEFLESRHRFFGRIALHVMPLERNLEIDDPIDFFMAEALLTRRARQRGMGRLPSPVEALVSDFDGVFTDNRVLVLQDGREGVLCDRGDGLGLGHLRAAGVPVLVLSKERNPVVAARCAKLGLECIQACDDKLTALRDWLNTKRVELDHVVYVGNDVNDIECLRAAGCGVVVADAVPEAKAAADIVLTSPGGRGALRELGDLIVSARESSGNGSSPS